MLDFRFHEPGARVKALGVKRNVELWIVAVCLGRTKESRKYVEVSGSTVRTPRFRSSSDWKPAVRKGSGADAPLLCKGHLVVLGATGILDNGVASGVSDAA